MKKGSLFKKCLSLVMVLAVLFSVAAPASAAVAALGEQSTGYVAIGDAMTEGAGLDQNSKAYFELVAEALGMQYNADIRGKRYRIEEVRYALDATYEGDGYTATNSGISSLRKTAPNTVKNAEVISINVGVNNFSTYIIDQMVYYLENNGAVKYAYSFDAFGDSDLQDSIENVKAAVKDRLLAAAPAQMDEAIELIDFVAEISTYTYLSYVTSFDAVVNEIYALNPDVELYIVGIYNAMAGEVLTVETGSRTVEIPIGEVFGALVELANLYTQVLAPRAFDYIYVDPGTPELLIDQMGDTSLPDENRIPSALKGELLNSVESTAISMIQEMFAQYGVGKTDGEALEIAETIFYDMTTSEMRRDYIKTLIQEFAVEEVIKRFQSELEGMASAYGDITVTEAEIITLLDNLEAATSDGERTEEATKFVVDLMTKAMVGLEISGLVIKDQDDAYRALELLEKNSQGDPTAKKEAAADIIMVKVAENDLSEWIDRDDVIVLLTELDDDANTDARKATIKAWMNEIAANKIVEKIKVVNPDYTVGDAMSLLYAMEGASEDDREAIAKNHLLKTGGFHAYMVEKFKAAFADPDGNGNDSDRLTLAGNYTSMDAFVTAVERADTNEEAKAIVRAEIRAAAAAKVEADNQFQMMMPTVNVANWFAQADDPDTDAHAYLTDKIWKHFNADPNNLNDPRRPVILYLIGEFLSGYDAYNDAATAAEEAFATYRDGVDTAAKYFAQYADLQEQAAAQILAAYENYYQGAGEEAQTYYREYLQLRNTAVTQVLNGYKEYNNAINLGLGTVDQFNETFESVFNQLREIAEVEKISLNHLLAVAKKLDANYVQSMVENLIQGDSLAAEDKTVAYIALRYYLANAMMIMPSAKGHASVAARIIDAIENGASVNSDAGELANKVINGGVDIYHIAENLIKAPTSGSGQESVLVNPEVYVAFGDNVTSGTALSNPALAYPQLIGNALAMDYINDDMDTEDDIYNCALNGMRAEELLMLVNSNYSGDAYTADRFGTAYMESLRTEYIEYVKNADLITINVGINNLTTFPLQQILLAYNGEETYEMDWARYIGQSRYNKINSGKNALTDLLLGIVDNAESREPVLDDLNAYEKAERAVDTLFTAIESLLYGLVGYAANVDAAVETIATLNSDATIVLIGFYNPLEGTYVNIDKSFEVKDYEVDLSKYTINVSALVDKLVNVSNRYLTNYVGDVAGNKTAADAGSRIVAVPILNTTLGVTDTGASKDLSTLTTVKGVTVKGHEIDLMIPEYFAEAGKNVGVNLHPNATGHAYIAAQVLNALDFEINATVYFGIYEKYVGDDDPDFTYVIDDLSSLYGTPDVTITREEGEVPGEYKVSAIVTYEGYKTVIVSYGKLIIKERPVDVDPVCKIVREGKDIAEYEVVQLAVLDAQPGDVIVMLKDSDQTTAEKLAEYHDAGTVNLLNGVTLDLKNYKLTLNALYAAEGNYVTATHETSEGVGGRLILPKENLILREGAVSYENAQLTTLPFWIPVENMAEGGYYVFGHFGIRDTSSSTTERFADINVADDYVKLPFRHRATQHLLENYFTDNGLTDNGLSIQVYLQWKTETGNSYQYFVVNDPLISEVAASGTMDYLYYLTNFSQLSIKVETLTITAQIVSDTGAVAVGNTWDVNGIITGNDTESDPDNTVVSEYTFTSDAGLVFHNETQDIYYDMLHKAVQEANEGDTIVMLGNSDQTQFTNVCPGAGVINLNKNLTLMLNGYALKVDALIVGEGSHVIGLYETDSAVGGRLVVPEDNFVLMEGMESYSNSALTALPFWLPGEGCYVFGHFGIYDTPTMNTPSRGIEINKAGDYVKFQFRHRATNHLMVNYFADNGLTDNRLSIQVYLQWETPTGKSYQYFVVNDPLIAEVVMSGSMDYVYYLTNFSQLSINADDLVVTASVVSSSGAAAYGNTYTTANDKIN